MDQTRAIRVPAIVGTMVLILSLGCGDDALPLDASVDRDAASEDASIPSLDGASDAVAPMDAERPDGLVSDAGRDSGMEAVTKAFPSAFGGGAEATGARADPNAVLVIVNTLDYGAPLTYDAVADVYEGGIKAAMEDDLDGRGRFIVFSVSGVINARLPQSSDEGAFRHRSGIAPEGSNVTILGQSAPRGGVTLHRSWIHYIRSTNIILRYLTVRTGLLQGSPIGDDRTTVPINVGASNAIIDHCSASWGGDKGLIIGDWRPGYPFYDTTVQHSIVTDSATLAFGVNGGGEADDFAAGGNITWHYNFLAGRNRTPNMGGFDGLGVIQNNVVQSDGSKLSTIVYGTPQINHANNHYRIYGSGGTTLNQFQNVSRTDPSIYTAGNRYEDNRGVLLEGTAGENNQAVWQYFGANGPLPSGFFVDAPHAATIPGPIRHPAPLISTADVFSSVLADVGNNRYIDDEGNPQFLQDEYDQRAIMNAERDVLEYRKYSRDWVLPTIPENSRPADYDTDKDGMADAWERREFGDLNQGYRDDADGDGYMNIEEFLNQVDRLDPS